MRDAPAPICSPVDRVREGATRRRPAQPRSVCPAPQPDSAGQCRGRATRADRPAGRLRQRHGPEHPAGLRGRGSRVFAGEIVAAQDGRAGARRRRLRATAGLAAPRRFRREVASPVRQVAKSLDARPPGIGGPCPRADAPAALARVQRCLKRGSGNSPAGGQLEAGQNLDYQPRPRVCAKKKARDRLIRLAVSHPDWVLGFVDEVWWSRYARPGLHAWGDAPLRLHERTPPRRDTAPKALACCGPTPERCCCDLSAAAR